MNFGKNNRGDREKDGMNGACGQRGPTPQFSFGARRYSTTGARRLFVPQKGFMSPVFAPESERTRAILRVFSTAI